MSINKKNLIVTLADANFINQAKQLLASVYFKAGWVGDYLLLACGVSEEDKAWFKAKGILIYDCQLLFDQPVGSKKYPPIVLSKFYLFQEYFKQWQKIIFLDADIIVRASLDDLLQVDSFGAVAATFAFRDEFAWDNWPLMAKLKNKYQLSGRPFNSGVFVFDTDLIGPETFSKLLALYQEFGALNVHGEEATFNLFFHKNWQELSIIYNSMPWYMNHFYNLNENDLKATVVHFVNSVKPWDIKSPYYQEWSDNLKKAEDINLANHQSAVQIFTPSEIKNYLKYLRKINFLRSWRLPFLFIDSQIGQLGLFIGRRYPKLYKLISLKKNV